MTKTYSLYQLPFGEANEKPGRGGARERRPSQRLWAIRQPLAKCLTGGGRQSRGPGQQFVGHGWIRSSSGSTAPAALSHAVYNLTLHPAAAIEAMS